MPLIYLPAFNCVLFFSFSVSSLLTTLFNSFTNTALTTFYSSFIFYISQSQFFPPFVQSQSFLFVSLFRINFFSISILFRNIVSIRIFFDGFFKYFIQQSMFIFRIAYTYFFLLSLSFVHSSHHNYETAWHFWSSYAFTQTLLPHNDTRPFQCFYVAINNSQAKLVVCEVLWEFERRVGAWSQASQPASRYKLYGFL